MNAIAKPFFLLLFAACSATAPIARIPGAEGFDAEGAAASWRFGSTGGPGPQATWQARADATAVSPPNVMSLVASNHRDDDRFNLCWKDGPQFRSGKLAVLVRADRGELDQGGGPMWRVQDADNYYVCRWNPLEDNFRVYVVTKGVRRQLATALVDVAAPGSWHRLEVEHLGTHIECSFDGKKLLEATDVTIPEAGGVGLWTKADACTSFDELLVAPIGG